MMRTAIVALIALASAACGQPEPEPEPVEMAEPEPEPAGPQVFFVQPTDGATVQSPVGLEFSTENFPIVPVPEGTVTETRPDLGHHHVGIDTDCLPAGTVVPSAAPWIHFGDGSNVIDMQLPPGEHRLTLQVGNDLHETIDGLCSIITVNVTE